MNTKIYKIDTGINGKNFKSSSKVNSPIVGSKTSFYSISNFKRGVEDFFLEGNLYFIDNQETLDTFNNALGNQWIGNKKYYLSHPKVENSLLESKSFHQYILMEQIGEVAAYIHENIPCNKISVSIREGNDFSSFSELNIEEDKLSEFGRVTLKDAKSLGLTFYGDESKESTDDSQKHSNIKNTKKEYLWINDYKDLISKVTKYKEKEFSYILNLDNSFGMSSKIAKKIGINPTWLNNIRIEFNTLF